MKRFMERLRLAYWRWRLRAAGLPAIAGGAAGTISGQRGTGNVLSDVLEVEFANSVAELEPNAAPLTRLTAAMNKDKTVNPKFTWFEDTLDVRFDTINHGGGYLSTDTSIVVATGTQWQADDLIYVPRTGEVLRITNVATNTLTVVRGVGSTAAALVDTDPLINIGSAAMEGALDKAAASSNPSEVFNYTQIFRRPVDMTGTMQSTANRTSPHDWYRQLNKKGVEHAKDIEYAAMFGHPSLDTSGAQPRRTTGGFIHYCTQNATDVGGTMTEAEFFSAISPIFRYDPGSPRAAFAARVPVDVLHTFPRSKLFIQQSEQTFGIKVVQVVTPHGNVNFMTHWLLEGTIYSGQIWIVDLANIGYRYLHGDNGPRDTKVRQNIQAPGADGRKDEYLTECGFSFKLPLTHGRITNITG
jgi:uncharacterized protein DUF5309